MINAVTAANRSLNYNKKYHEKDVCKGKNRLFSKDVDTMPEPLCKLISCTGKPDYYTVEFEFGKRSHKRGHG